METNGAVQGAVPMDDSDDEELDIIRDIETVQGPDEVVLIQHDKYGLDTTMVRDVVQLDVESEHSISNDMDVDQLQNGVQLEHEGDDDLVREINGVSISTMDGRVNDRFQYGNRAQGNRSNISAATSGVTTSAYVDDRDTDDMDILNDLDTPRGPQNMGNPSIPQSMDLEEDDLLEEAVSPLGHQQ